MTTEEAIRRLDDMQGQIIHGKRTFGDIADIIRNSEKVRLAALFYVGTAIDAAVKCPDYPMTSLSLAHRILANNRPDGEFAGATVDSLNESSSLTAADGSGEAERKH